MGIDRYLFCLIHVILPSVVWSVVASRVSVESPGWAYRLAGRIIQNSPRTKNARSRCERLISISLDLVRVVRPQWGYRNSLIGSCPATPSFARRIEVM